MTSCLSFSANALLALSVSGSKSDSLLFLCFIAERAALADFGLDLSCCCSTSAHCFSLSAFFIAKSLSLCSLRNSVRFCNSSGSILESANASAMALTGEVEFFRDDADDDDGEAGASLTLVGRVDTADVSITEKLGGLNNY